MATIDETKSKQALRDNDMGITEDSAEHASIGGVEIFEKAELSEEARRLAEMGYEEVRIFGHFLSPSSKSSYFCGSSKWI